MDLSKTNKSDAGYVISESIARLCANVSVESDVLDLREDVIELMEQFATNEGTSNQLSLRKINAKKFLHNIKHKTKFADSILPLNDACY